MLFFKNKEPMSEEEKNILKQVIMYYELNRDIFVNYYSISEKKKIIYDVFASLNYDNVPDLASTSNSQLSDIKIYRGISAKDEKLLKNYVDDFLNGKVFFGKRASIYGTGIYTVIGDLTLAQDYSSDGGINNCGVIIESNLKIDAKVIDYSKINEMRDFLIKKLRESYKEDISNFLSILDDDGALAAILGYDAILVKEKNYLIVLNRGELVINDSYLFSQLESISKDRSLM